MATKYKYNSETCRYEPYFVRGKLLRKRIFNFLSLCFAIAVAGYFWYTNNHGISLQEFILKQKNITLKVEWDILRDRIGKSQEKLASLIEKDDNNYRVIIDSSPLAPSIREAGIGGSEKINNKQLKEFPTILQDYVSIEKLKHQLDIEIQSYNEIDKTLDKKIAMWASRPAIQPISNIDLTKLHTTYGARFHPLLGYVREHKGLDFSADVGTPVYATGDGEVKSAYFSGSFGNVIYLNHNFGYETRYAHLSRFNVITGQKVRRGEVIGFLGSTGLSGGPHLHYEVLINGEQTNPINFFQRDLSNKEYEKLIEEGSKNKIPLD
jgi:murein DD-endopeptidase MepM/ murein hydrolase activator NlpD